KDRSQSASERQTFLFVHRNLGDAANLVFNRIFDSNNLIFVISDFVERAIERRRLTRSGRSRYQHHSVRLFDKTTESRKIVGLESNNLQTEIAELFVDLLFVQDTDNCVFTVDAGHNGNAEVNGSTGDAHPETTILWNATLGDVQFGHDFDSGNNRLMVPNIDRIGGLIERAVNPVFNDNFVVACFDVNI